MEQNKVDDFADAYTCFAAIIGESIFQVLENADKHCIVAIDEFQQIIRYPDRGCPD